MKKTTVLFALLFLSVTINKGQTINCGSFCVSDITINNVTHTMNVTIRSLLNSGQVNYPSIMVVNNMGDTIANINQAYYYFAQLPGTTLVHNIPATDTSITGLPYSIYLKDNIYFNGCIFNYPMTCFVGIDEASSLNTSFSIFPDQANNSLNFNLGELNGQSVVINLYDNKGQLVKTVKTDNNLATINTEGFANGIYFANVTFGDIQLKNKFIISH